MPQFLKSINNLQNMQSSVLAEKKYFKMQANSNLKFPVNGQSGGEATIGQAKETMQPKADPSAKQQALPLKVFQIPGLAGAGGKFFSSHGAQQMHGNPITLGGMLNVGMPLPQPKHGIRNMQGSPGPKLHARRGSFADEEAPKVGDQLVADPTRRLHIVE